MVMKQKHSRAIVRSPGRTYANCLRRSNKEEINTDKAVEQHSSFCKQLGALGIDIIKLPPSEKYPDACFVEDTIVILGTRAIVCRLKELSRRGEEEEVQREVSSFIKDIHEIHSPGILEGGDVIITPKEIFVGCGVRSNADGIEQLMELAKDHMVSAIEHYQGLHLKSVCTYVGDDTVVLDAQKIDKNIFRQYRTVLVDDQESYAANCIAIDNHIILPKGSPKLTEQLGKLGFKTCTVDLSEFRKGDASITCLAVVF